MPETPFLLGLTRVECIQYIVIQGKNKSKILAECCLALGIPARRVFIMPFSPYDTDNHVVNEIYDDTREKWVMMDPTTGGMFVDENRTPLSLIEM